MSVYDKYKATIGLEVHIQLRTNSKAYSSDINEFGSLPNTNVSPVSLGHPGTLPKVNAKTYEYAVKLGLAVNGEIRERNEYARKNYFYADLPKGYQITQDTTPIINGGRIQIKLEDGKRKDINLTRTHLEEDSGKSIHNQDPYYSLIDLNRAGVPLLEIVSEPEIDSSDEAYAYLTEVRKLVRYLEICDGNMEEGSMRCDANVSVMLKDATEFGTKVEVKNMNSIRNVQRAIEFEIKRQIDMVEAGETIYSETRGYDAVNDRTLSQRTKEAANDYRFFPEPDLLPVMITQDFVNEVKESMPPLPNELFDKYTKEFGLSEYDAGVLTDTKEVALFYEDIIAVNKNFKACANWVMGPVKSFLNENALTIDRFPLTTKHIADLVQMIGDNKISNSAATQRLFPALLEQADKTAEELAQELNLLQDSSEDTLEPIIQEVLDNHPDEVARYKGGEKKLTGFFMGKIMKASKGKADPKNTNIILQKLLNA
jgi:aspartyl-tRNA(Asn)/glutamyl-tRNA(Gln) amidotransferase subunit B